MKQIHIGRQCYTLRDGPEREAQFRLDLAKANKPSTVKQARAKANARGAGRKIPRFVAAMRTADYVALYYELNAVNFIAFNAHDPAHKNQVALGRRVLSDFFNPLPEGPSAVLVGEEVVEEVTEETTEEALA